MTTIKQIEANRRNAQKSTGPKTSAGKSIASQNAIGAGIFSKNPLLPQESPEEFEHFSRGVLQAYPPIDAISAAFAERIILAMWRKRRLQIAETAKLQLATRDEKIIHEVNIAMKRFVLNTMTTEDISVKQENHYQSLKLLENEMQAINGMHIDHDLSNLKVHAPKLHKVFIDQLDKKHGADERKNLSLDALREELTLLMSRIQSNIIDYSPKHEAYQLALLIKAERSMLPESDFNLFNKYENQINTEINRAIEGYKKHCEWLEKTVEAETIAAE